MGRSRTASAPQHVGKPDHLRGTRASGANCRQDQRCDGTRCPIVLLGPPRPCAGLCHRDSMASHWLVGRFVRRAVTNTLATSVGIEAPSGGCSGIRGNSALEDRYRILVGPEGFDVTVTSLDLRPGGELVYLMTATAPEQVAFMKQAGMPLTNECKVTYVEVSPPSRLAYKTLPDFVPGVAPYEVATVVELQPATEGVKLTITFDGMHDEVWTQRARAGHESQMRKLDTLLAAQGRPNVDAL